MANKLPDSDPLALGEREIESDRLLMLSEKDPGFPALLSKKVSEILRVAREHTAPPLIGSDAVKEYFFTALSLLRQVHTELLDNLLSVPGKKPKVKSL
jgi:hypothetical protein